MISIYSRLLVKGFEMDNEKFFKLELSIAVETTKLKKPLIFLIDGRTGY